MKYIRTIKVIGIFTVAIIVVYGAMFTLINVLNADLYGRLIETERLTKTYHDKPYNDNLPTLTLILHKYSQEQNTIECSIVLHYDRKKLFDSTKTNKIDFQIKVIDGYVYNPTGLNKIYSFSDSTTIKTLGSFYAGLETDRFELPIAVSLNGYPFDNLRIRPMIDFYQNNEYADYNFEIQKRISGRIFLKDEADKLTVELTRTSIEKYLVVVSSIIFILLTLILTYGLITTKRGLNTVEEIIAVAGYILATAGFRDILGLSKINGTSALEIVVILVPLLTISLGLFYSLLKSNTGTQK